MERAQIGSDLKVGYATHEGMSGKHNEDFFGMFAWTLDDRRNFYLGVVADGVGGQSAGEVASRLTVGAIQKYFDQQAQVENNVSAHLGQAIQVANETVHESSLENPERRGMSTTVAAAAFVNNRLYTAHVGDSRIYLLRDGRLRQISIDHTWAQEAIEAGLLTPEQAKTHPNRNVIRRHLGGQPNVQVDHRLVFEPGQSGQEAVGNQGLALQGSDTILICSDGLTDMISDDSVRESLQKHFSDLPRAVQELIDKANRAGGRDNITLVLMQVRGEAPPMVVAPVGGAAAAAAGSGTVQPAATPVATSAPAASPVESKSGRGAVWLIIGGAILLLLLAIVVGLVIAVSTSLGGDATPTIPELQMTAPPDVTLPAGAPATAAILATAGALGTPGLEGSGLVEPDLIPTLRSTLTATPASAGRLATATPTATPTPTASSAGGGPRATSTPRPPNTKAPATSTPQATNAPPTATSGPTNTPALPTATHTMESPTNTPAPTNTPVPPTNTPAPTNTPVPPTNTAAPTNSPAPTNTPEPPTDTPEPTSATNKELPPEGANGAQRGQ
ncbi:MAG: protein phosphatase 2C domain-containing protein [Chloroflexota bacterium]|nr:MAG: protein phosphatase 2C domain-containing protein [Chloroflexota bacterium]